MDVKWGIDGSSGLGNFKQGGKGLGNDGYVLLTSIVPVRNTTSQENTAERRVICSKPKPSTLWCRPVKFEFAVFVGVREELYRFGFSPLHAWIHSFE